MKIGKGENIGGKIRENQSLDDRQLFFNPNLNRTYNKSYFYINFISILFEKKINFPRSQRSHLSTVKNPLMKLFEDIQIYLPSEYQKESIQISTISRINEEGVLKEFNV